MTGKLREGVVPTIDTNLLANGAVDDRHGGGREGGDVKAVNTELLFAQGLDTSHNYGKVGWWHPAMTALMATFSTVARP